MLQLHLTSRLLGFRLNRMRNKFTKPSWLEGEAKLKQGEATMVGEAKLQQGEAVGEAVGEAKLHQH